MLGLKIFLKSMSQIFYNLSDALNLTGLLYLVMTVLNIAISYFMLGVLNIQDVQKLANAEELALTPGYWVTILALILVNVVFSAWIAVLWHRYMLLAEQPLDLLPPFRSDVTVAYIFASIRVFLILLAAVIPLMILFAALLTMGVLSGVISFVIFGFLAIAYVFYISLRISLVLPSHAIGKTMSVGESWHKTGSASSAILIAGLLMGIGAFIAQSLGLWVLSNGVLLLIFNTIIGWFFVMISVTILTTLYGYLVEGRSLD